jgi:hypothetical protein
MKTSITKRSHKGLRTLLAIACASGFSLGAAKAQNPNGITTVFYILLENRCFTSGTDTSYSNVLFNNKNGASPYLTSLCTPGSTTYTVSYQGNTISQTAHSSFCSAYHNVFGTYNNTNVSPYGANVPNGTSVHPSEPNYVFMECGSNLSKLDDNDPYYSGASVQQIANFLAANPAFTGENLSALLQNAGITWTSYTEGTCLLNSAGQDFNYNNTTGGSTTSLTNNIAPIGTRTVPLVSFSGPSSLTCTVSSTSTTVTTTNTANIQVGMYVYGNYIPTGTTVTGITNGTTFTMSNAATALANPSTATATSGTLLSGTKSESLYISFYQNPWNGSTQYNFASKHTGSLFFPATNGGTVTTPNQTPSNVEVSHYEPLENFLTDLANNTQAQYCVITPDQYNDGHTALSANFTYSNYGGTASGVTKYYEGGSDLARVAQMDSFCAQIVPQIMASPVYQAGHAAIVLWTDETEGSPQNDFYHTLTEIVISPLAKGNAYNSTLNYTHSSDLATMQEIFGVVANTPTGYLNDAANPSNATPSGVTVTNNTGQGLQNATGQPYFGFGTGTATDLSDLFVPGTIPTGLPGLNLTPSGFVFNRKTNTDTQTVTVTNVLSQAINTPIYLVVGDLSTNTTLTNSLGTTSNVMPGSPYVLVSNTGLAAGATVTVTLKFTAPTSGVISESLSVVATSAP